MERQTIGLNNVNEFLANTARADLVGPEMWSGFNPTRGDLSTRPDSWIDYGVSAQLPHLGWNPPKPGFNGTWAYGHVTNLEDILQIQIVHHDREVEHLLELKPSRNRWTPAYLTTYYRSMPLKTNGAYPYAGYVSVKETKCITKDNVFVAELFLTHDHSAPQEYSVSIVAPHFEQTDIPGQYRIDLEIGPGGLQGKVPIQGCGVLVTGGEIGPGSRFAMKPHQTLTLRYAFCLDHVSGEAKQRALIALKDASVFARNESEFNHWFTQKVPKLCTENEDLLKMYYYRWFVVYRGYHLPRRVIPEHPYPRPAFYESPFGGWFGCVIGLPVGSQLQETRWLRDSAPGCHHIQNWAESVPGYRSFIQFTPKAVWEFYQNHPDPSWLSAVYEPMKAYALSYVNPQDKEALPVQKGSWPTGAEYQPNFYQFTSPPWDWRHDKQGQMRFGFEPASLIRLDLATHTIANLFACAEMAAILEKCNEAQMLETIAKGMLETLKRKCWDESSGMFYAADPVTGKLADQAPCFDSFVPFMWGIVSGKPYLRAFEKFFDPAWFWSEFPITTVSKTCPMYWSGNCITGPAEATPANPHPYVCSWNGPAWHFANGLMAEALGSAARAEGEGGLRDGWLEFMRRWSEMHFLYGDRTVPCSNEHVRPDDGARFSLVMDYFHSAWIDPFMRYWAGIHVDASKREVTFDPFAKESFELRHVPVIRRQLTFVQSFSDGKCVKSILDENGKVLASVEGNKVMQISVL